jgi:hypothetical protein
MNSTMDDMNLIQHAQRHHLVVREPGEKRDLEIAEASLVALLYILLFLVAKLNKLLYFLVAFAFIN